MEVNTIIKLTQNLLPYSLLHMSTGDPYPAGLISNHSQATLTEIYFIAYFLLHIAGIVIFFTQENAADLHNVGGAVLVKDKGSRLRPAQTPAKVN